MKARLSVNVFGGFFLVDAYDDSRAWSGSRFVAHEGGLPALPVQVCNFDDEESARKYARESGLEIVEGTVVVLRLRPIELAALRSIVLDRLLESPKKKKTEEWIEVLTDEKTTVDELLALLTQV